MDCWPSRGPLFSLRPTTMEAGRRTLWKSSQSATSTSDSTWRSQKVRNTWSWIPGGSSWCARGPRCSTGPSCKSMSSGLTTAPSLIYPWRSWQLVTWRWEKIPWVFLRSPPTSSTGNHVGFWRRQRMGSFDATAQLATREKFANMSLPSTTSTAGLRFSHMVQPFPWNYSKYLSIFCKSLIIFKHPSKLSKIVKLSKLSKINKIVKNCQKFSNCQKLSNFQKLSKL